MELPFNQIQRTQAQRAAFQHAVNERICIGHFLAKKHSAVSMPKETPDKFPETDFLNCLGFAVYHLLHEVFPFKLFQAHQAQFQDRGNQTIEPSRQGQC